MCDVLSQDPQHDVWFIPLPELMPGNKGDHIWPWLIRDVTCTNGSLKFIEIERLCVPAPAEESVAACDLDTVYDDRCFESSPSDCSNMKPPILVGWRAIIWNRAVSDDCWRKECEVHDDGIFIENPHHFALLDQLGSTMMNLLPCYPILSIHGDDVIHMSSKVRLDNEKSHMFSIDMRNKTLKTLVQCHSTEADANCPLFPCVLSNHLSNTPGNY